MLAVSALRCISVTNPTPTPAPTAPPTKSLLARILEHPKVAAGRTWATGEYAKLSRRERLILAGLGGVVVFMASWGIYEPTRDLFADQRLRLEKTVEAVQTSSSSLERYVKLKARRDLIEREYRGVEIKEGVYAHLENLIRTKLGLSSGFTIKDSPPKGMGGNFEQITYSMKFTTPTLQPIVDLLKEVVHGQRPLLLSSLDIVKRPRGDTLDVSIDVVSIREASGSQVKKEES